MTSKKPKRYSRLPTVLSSPLLAGKKDQLFKKLHYPKSGFVFDERVTEVFDDMIVRSIPFYEQVLEQCVRFLLQKNNHREGGVLYDLGSSTGNFILSLVAAEQKFFGKNKNYKKWYYVGFDNSPAMVERAESKCEVLFEQTAFISRARVNFCCKDIIALQFSPRKDLADKVKKMQFEFPRTTKLTAITMHYTLQFMPVPKRRQLLAKVYKALKKGGFFILSEKVEEGRALHEHFSEEYYRFKSDNQYSDSEINSKRNALEKVLVPLSTNVYLTMLKALGFREVAIAFKWNNFVTIFAVK